MADQKVTVVATRLKLRNLLKLKPFFKANGEIKRQLKHTPGLLRYRQKADFLRLRFSTISTWENTSSVDVFVRTGAHRDAMAVFDDIAVRDASAFTRWETEEPEETTWEEAGKRLAGVMGPAFL